MDLGTSTWFVRPEFNLVSQQILGDAGDSALNIDFSSVGIAFGFRFGGAEKKVKALEERMDKLEGKVDDN